MSHLSFMELRRIADALATLRGALIADALMRGDGRQLRFELADGRLGVVGIATDGDGRPRLEIDIVAAPVASPQLEVRFETA
jgi:hypothetical protein